MANELAVRHSRPSHSERLVNDGPLLHLVRGVRAGRRARRLFAGDASVKAVTDGFEPRRDSRLPKRTPTEAMYWWTSIGEFVGSNFRKRG